MAKVIYPDGREESAASLELEAMQAIVGGYIQEIRLPDGTIMVCNEEGKLMGLEPNMKATEIWWQWYGATDTIVGPVLICDPDELQ